MAVDVDQANQLSADLLYLQARQPPLAGEVHGETIGIVDLFSGCGGMSLGAIEGARRGGRPAELNLAVDVWATALEVLELTLDLDEDRLCELDLTALLENSSDRRSNAQRAITQAGGNASLLLAGPPCQGHSALNNHTRHDDDRNDLYGTVARVAELLEPRVVIVENVRGVGRDRRDGVTRCTHDLETLGYRVRPKLVDIHALGAAQRRVRHVLVATRRKAFDFDKLALVPNGRSIGWAIADLEGRHGNTLFDTASVPTKANLERIDYLFDEDVDNLPNSRRPRCHQSQHSYVSMYGRLSWNEPAQTITSGFGSMGQGRFIHPLARRTLTPHEAARLQFLPDFMDFSLAQTRSELATMIGNAVPPILTIALIGALIDQDLL